MSNYAIRLTYGYSRHEGIQKYDTLGVPQIRMNSDRFSFSTAPGIKVLEFADFTQEPQILKWDACPHIVKHSLQNSTDNMGNGEIAYRWLPSDITRMSFGQVPAFGGIFDGGIYCTYLVHELRSSANKSCVPGLAFVSCSSIVQEIIHTKQ